MTDRELLEAAAKAADMPPSLWWFKDGVLYFGGDLSKPWNPLTDDGDALRLAVKLGIKIGRVHPYGKSLAFIGWDRDYEGYWEEGLDPYAATRRAIVRAAAALSTDGSGHER